MSDIILMSCCTETSLRTFDNSHTETSQQQDGGRTGAESSEAVKFLIRKTPDFIPPNTVVLILTQWITKYGVLQERAYNKTFRDTCELREAIIE